MEKDDIVTKIADPVKKVVMNLLNIEKGSTGELLFEQTIAVGSALIPLGSAAYNAYKFFALNKKLDGKIQVLNRLNDKVQILEEQHKQFVTRKAFPLVMESMYHEQEEEKISIILNGFEKVIDRPDVDESMMRAYYDVLNSLRTSEIIQLIKYDKRSSDDSRQDLVEYISLLMDDTREGKERLAEVKGYKNYVGNKLEQLGLIVIKRKWGSLNGKEVFDNEDKIGLSQFGENFIDFFKDKKRDV
ncbi:hypothetical protein [Brevibacillus halotolerans]|uniref:hypothetical protein n=1 Tax=Brevibacillus halotolerans TaxID=1507437 RepID=UPI0015EE8FD0|nr:hypothetical protein [Brevibacillus halotolerans]MBA4534404.1 hypothetical protein [Brevibacillus halotolerans]